MQDKPFRHPQLTKEEMHNGCRLGWDTWADTSCSGKHAYVDEFIVGKSVTATGFTASLGSVQNLPMANVLYAYDTLQGATILLQHNNTIYLGKEMNDSLANPIQAEEEGVRIDLRPKRYYKDDVNAQSITLANGVNIPVLYDGVLPYIPVRRPTADEIESCPRFALSSKEDWDPFVLDGNFSQVSGKNEVYDTLQSVAALGSVDPLSSSLMSSYLGEALRSEQVLSPTFINEHDAYSHRDETFTTVQAIKSSKKDSLTPEELSKKWSIGLNTAAATINATTHKCIRTTGLLSKRFRTDKAQLRHKQLSRQYGTFYVDYLKVGVTSIRQFIGGTLYTNKLGFKKFFPCSDETSTETGHTFRLFIEFVGLPFSLHSDNHNNFKEGLFKRLLRKFGVYSTYTEPHSPWQNRAEPAIGEVKRYARKIMQKTQTPLRLWCFCYEYSADLLSLCASGRYDLKGRTPYEAVMHYTPDISEYTSFTWFQWCWYFDESTKSKRLCRWLGPAHHIGQAFCSYILIDNAEFLARSSVIGIPDHDLESLHMKTQTEQFSRNVEERIGNHRQAAYDGNNPGHIYYTAFQDDVDLEDNVLPYGDEIIDANEMEVSEAYQEALDTYLGAQVVVPGKDSQPILAKVKKRKRDSMGNAVGSSNANPILDTRVYELEFPDGRVEEYGVNIIAENLMAQVDGDGWDCGILEEIVSFRKDEAVAIPRGEERATATVNGIQKPVITTKGWDVEVKWRDQSTSWVPLKIIKECNPIEVAEFAIANNYDKEPAFAWWVRKVLKKKERMINKVVTRCRKPGRMKFGLDVPNSVDEALAIDKKNGNTFWADAIKKEMTNSRVAFHLLDKDEKPPPGYKRITCHLIFDVKMDLTRKARYVAGGHLTDPPTSLTYASVVSRDSVRIGFLVAALNDLDILAGDVQNAYLNADTKEKVYFVAGSEWKANEGRTVLIVKALYGLKSSALAWRNHLADTLGNKLGFKSSLADPDVWLKPETSKEGKEYYSYILVYSDDILIIHKEPSKYMEMLQDSYTVKPESIQEPSRYLGADISKVYYDDGSHAWTLSSESYVKEAVKNVKRRLTDDGYKFNSKLSDPNYSAPNPFSSVSYRPELDTSLECNDEQTQFFQNLIGVLRWIVELGRIDIAFEVSLLSRYLAYPRTGHLLQALHMFKHLEIHSKNKLSFDPAYQYVASDSDIHIMVQNMKDLYQDAQEDIPPNAPKPRGQPVQVNCFVDSDHAGDTVTRRSQSGILLYCNSAPILWHSKRQNTVEDSTFGSEFVAFRIASDLIISLRYKLRMFGIPIDGPAQVFCDNESVYKNAALASSKLKKKHNSICFHRVRECVASGILIPFKVSSANNLSDILTKSLPVHTRVRLRSMIMYSDEPS